MIIRENYLKKIRGFYQSDLVKVIQGIRRCGKSIILETIKNEIEKISDNIIYLNFENVETANLIKNHLDLINYVKNNRKDKLCYCFFDEVQELPNWFLAIRHLRLNNYSIFITGSNSKLLSNEFVNYLSGRYVSFTIYPFVYKEIVEYAKELNITPDINDYIIWGGFPKRFELSTLSDQIHYLNNINNTIIYNDIITRFKIRNIALFRKLVDYVLISNSRIFSSKSIYDYIKSVHYDCSVNTITKYIQYLKDAFIIQEIGNFSLKAKKQLNYYGKLYNTDVSFNSLINSNNRFDLEHNLENIVYNELLYMGYSVDYLSAQDYEIDFRCKKGNKVYLVQVAYSIAGDNTYQREMKGFNKLDNSAKKIFISNDLVDFSTSNVKHISLKDFLLMDNLE